MDPPRPDVENPVRAGAGLVSRNNRERVMLSADVRTVLGGTAARHRVRDLSEDGARLDNASLFATGSRLLVTIGALHDLEALVVWVRDGQAGIRFAHRIDTGLARSKAFIRPTQPVRSQIAADTAPHAGWIADLNDPYRRGGRTGR